ncbi:5'-methylthioadenosine/S-adenosylhomocysteine nucleosidase [Candidatus Izimaplasma bacterium HR1]|jgi:adenosylhomocysteine nucleosidase|uniref:5'-methylthioadenosine/adenosylhomocysteine nucleosidase n=1 Tax=Candidatus Izimoplasma sp. HR1 TaxID=1541959 RepID=UPI0004F6A412|nr:5'-methylthioadenosine/S-adenosylhomocysteine nucleosidase [Candidatus Izimaplasma bacterium HR1]
MIGIIGAMDIELETIKKEVTNLTEEARGIRTFYTGTIEGKQVVIVLAGIGKVNAAITTSKLLEEYDVDYVINIGVAGGQNGVTHKDIVISTEVLYHDVDVTSFGSRYVHGQVPGMDATFKADKTLISKTIKVLENANIAYHLGKVASGDQFVTSKETIAKVNELYNDILAIEMEACAIAHTASIYKIPFIIYRSISDVLDDETQGEDFDKFVEEASIKASVVLRELIKEL